jgi:DNA-directed RNA polymerase specialized sigma24 family protein
MSGSVQTRTKARKADLMNSFQTGLTQTWGQALECARKISVAKEQAAQSEQQLCAIALRLAEEYQQTPAAIASAIDLPKRTVNTMLRRARERRKQKEDTSTQVTGNNENEQYGQ